MVILKCGVREIVLKPGDKVTINDINIIDSTVNDKDLLDLGIYQDDLDKNRLQIIIKE